MTESWASVLRSIEPICVPRVLVNPISIGVPCHAPKAERVLFLGRLREKKGIYDLLHAWVSVQHEFPDAKLVLAGDGEVDRVSELAVELGVGNSVELPGWIDGDSKKSELSSASIFVLPSYFEGLPVCILEAMGQGIPVISSRVGGVADVLQDEVEGLLIDAGDIEALAGALRRLLHDPVLRAMLGSAGRCRAEREFATPVVLDKLAVIYRTHYGLPARQLSEAEKI